MSDSFCIIPQTWRHVCPQIRDLSAVVSISKPYAKIQLPHDLVIQGAGVDNLYLRGVFKTQCGFRCDPTITLAPLHGALELYGNGWIYTPRLPRTVTDTDVFHYKLVLNSETSLEAKVSITFSS
jgi:hypothetical protein